MSGPALAPELETPVVLFIFNRPRLTARVLSAIAAARPRRLLVVADGPRSHVAADRAACEAARAIVRAIDWECDVSYEFAETNLGCGRRVASGLDWVFAHVDRAVILEDDCLPHPSFFPFAAALLDRYATHERVFHIAGTSFPAAMRVPQTSYDFSIFPLIWGWATWRRAWRHYDRDMREWPALRAAGWLEALWRDQAAADYWRETFDIAFSKAIDTWDLQWMFSCWRRAGLGILPSVNMISNLGVDCEATHMSDVEMFGSLANMTTRAMPTTMTHPAFVARDRKIDAVIQEQWASVCPLARVREMIALAAGGES